MGSKSHFKAHIGCYIVAPEVEQLLITNDYICSNSKCINHVKLNALHKNCPACGEKGITTQDEDTEIKILRLDEFCLENNLQNPFETVENDDGEFWIYNGIPARKIGQFCEDISIEIKNLHIDEQIAKCLNDSTFILDKIKETFGGELEIKFGVVPYYCS